MKRFLFLFTVWLLIVLSPFALRAQAQGFFQGFEIDASDWFNLGQAEVIRVSSGDPSNTYNSGSTSVYADMINAATGSWFGRVMSAISTKSCTLLPAGGGPSLQCYGPYTYFGRDTTIGYPFPPGGFTIQVDIYLDVEYAMQHPDCGQQGGRAHQVCQEL